MLTSQSQVKLLIITNTIRLLSDKNNITLTWPSSILRQDFVLISKSKMVLLSVADAISLLFGKKTIAVIYDILSQNIL